MQCNDAARRTDGYGAFEHVQALIQQAGTQFLDYVIVNDQRVAAAQLAQYNEKGSMPVTPDIKIEHLGSGYSRVLISNKDLVRHNPAETGAGYYFFSLSFTFIWQKVYNF